MKHENLPYLKHVLDAIADIERSTKKLSKEEFKGHKDIRDATVRRIEIIGEAVKNISSDLRQKHPEIEWAKIAGTRDIMIHAYFNVDLDIVWNIIKKDLPKLKKQISRIVGTHNAEKARK
jgi:uncharacterized protein with HEPN domain